MRFVHFPDDTTAFASDSDINNVHATVTRELVGVAKISLLVLLDLSKAFDSVNPDLLLNKRVQLNIDSYLQVIASYSQVICMIGHIQ